MLNPAPPHWARLGAGWPQREASRFVAAAGLTWHVQQWPGGGAPLLLLHGTGAATHTWRGLRPLLAGAVLAPDLPGHGFSGALPAAHRSMAGMAHATGELLRVLGVVPRAVLGHSAGCALALRMRLDGHLPAATPVLGLNAALLPFAGLAGWLFAPMARLLAANPVVPWLAAWRAQDERAVRRLVASTGSRLDDTGIALYAALLRHPGHVAGALAMMAQWDLDTLQRDLHAEPPSGALHLLVGEADTTVPPAQADAVARHLNGVVLHRLPGLGHLAHEEAPQRVADLLQTLLAPAQAEAARTT